MIKIGDRVNVKVSIQGFTNLDVWSGRVSAIRGRDIEVTVPFSNGNWLMVQDEAHFTSTSPNEWSAAAQFKL